MNKTYVEQYRHLEVNHWWFIVRRKILMQSIQKVVSREPGDTLQILNVGAASGASSLWLASLGNVMSLENEPDFLSCLQQQQIPVVQASVTDIPLPDNFYDLVCAFDVIEHVEDDEKALSELARVCKPGGTILITVPAFQALWGTHDEVNGHFRRYRFPKLIQQFQQLPVSVSYHTYFNTILFLPLFFFRQWSRLMRKRTSATADFSYFSGNNTFNRLMGWIFNVEVFLLRKTRLPFGVSLLLAARKNPAGNRKPHQPAKE